MEIMFCVFLSHMFNDQSSLNIQSKNLLTWIFSFEVKRCWNISNLTLSFITFSICRTLSHITKRRRQPFYHKQQDLQDYVNYSWILVERRQIIFCILFGTLYNLWWLGCLTSFIFATFLGGVLYITLHNNHNISIYVPLR